jgi:alkylation response protein AidB-like acyl-CoA dehydrogenase
LQRLPDTLAGKMCVAYCLTEPEAGPNLSNVRTTACETALQEAACATA